jgi:SAM-dependent methyltransferase
MTLEDDRRKWNLRYREGEPPAGRPEPHALALAWRHLWIGGAMLDAACGLGRGIASGIGAFAPIYAVDHSEEAIAQARRLWSGREEIRWIVADVAALHWPERRFGLVTAFGFTEMRLFRQVPRMLRSGGMFLYEGFSARQRELKPHLNPEWIGDPEALRALFAGGQILELSESEAPPFRVRMAALAP